MDWIWIISIQLLVLALLFRSWPMRNKNKNLPPGPKGYPIFGSLHLLGKLPHRNLRTLSRKYGPIMHMKLGVVNTIVVSSSKAAKLFLQTHDHVFASRPSNEVFKHLFNGEKDLVFAEYGPYWRIMRKLCTHELLSSHKVSSFEPIRREELYLLIDDLREAAKNGVVVDLRSKVASFNANVIYLMLFGKKYVDEELDERGFRWVVQEILKLAGIPNLGDFIPYIGVLDIQGLNRRAKSIGKVFHRFVDRIIDERLESKTETTKAFLDDMLDNMSSEENKYQLNRSTIKVIAIDMLLGAVDTSITTIEWALVELIKHPHIMKKLQEELEKVVGLNRMVEESDLSHLKYLDMIVKETFRLHPAVPLLAPHESMEDCTINNMYISKNSRIIVNAWAIGRDPSVWIDAEKFFPERFINSELDVKGRDFQMIPFGSGRRICPGMLMGINVVNLVIAQLVHCFDFKLPTDMPPSELDMTEEFGLTCPRAKHLRTTLIYRIIN